MAVASHRIYHPTLQLCSVQLVNKRHFGKTARARKARKKLAASRRGFVDGIDNAGPTSSRVVRWGTEMRSHLTNNRRLNRSFMQHYKMGMLLSSFFKLKYYNSLQENTIGMKNKLEKGFDINSYQNYIKNEIDKAKEQQKLLEAKLSQLNNNNDNETETETIVETGDTMVNDNGNDNENENENENENDNFTMRQGIDSENENENEMNDMNQDIDDMDDDSEPVTMQDETNSKIIARSTKKDRDSDDNDIDTKAKKMRNVTPVDAVLDVETMTATNEAPKGENIHDTASSPQSTDSNKK